MNGKSYKIGTSQRDIRLREQVAGSSVNLQADGSRIFYLINPGNGHSVRTEEVTEATSSANNTNKTYTVAAGSVYRENENVEIQSTGDEYKGICRITEINSNILTLRVETDDFTFVTGDKILIPADPLVGDGKEEELTTRQITKIRVKSEFTTSTNNLIVTVYDIHHKKKN